MEDAALALEQSAADGLMIGRGAVIRPEIFSEICSHFTGGDDKSCAFDPEEMYYTFTELLIERFAPEKRLSRLRLFTCYFSQRISFGHFLNAGVQGSSTFDEAVEKTRQFFAQKNY